MTSHIEICNRVIYCFYMLVIESKCFKAILSVKGRIAMRKWQS